MKKITGIIALAALFAATLPADEFVINGDPSDGYVNASGTVNSGQPIFAGGSIGEDSQRSGFPVFVLPTLPENHFIVSVNLTLGLYQNSADSGGMNADIYAMRTSADSTRFSTDYFRGAYGTQGDNGTAIMDDFTTPDTATGDISLDATAQTALATWLQTEYDAGAEGGYYVILRVSHDKDTLGTHNWFRFNDGENNQSQSIPILTITTSAPPAEGADVVIR